MSAIDLTGPHWGFALAVYGRPSTPDACLMLQERCGVDVNVLLLGLYAWSVGDVDFTAARLEAVDALAASVREEVVKPLRKIRQRMKQMDEARNVEPWESLRNRVKSAEIAAEQMEQAIVATAVSPGAGERGEAQARRAAENVVRFYAARIGAEDTDEMVKGAIDTIVAAVMAVAADGS